jgi:hypothetical protein
MGVDAKDSSKDSMVEGYASILREKPVLRELPVPLMTTTRERFAMVCLMVPGYLCILMVAAMRDK